MKLKRGHKYYIPFVIFLVISILIIKNLYKSEYSLSSISYKVKDDKIQKSISE